MRAIHNQILLVQVLYDVVPDVKDTNLWEQFTTRQSLYQCKNKLFLMSKIRTYESNSQPMLSRYFCWSCCSWCQRYELMRAIHNYVSPVISSIPVVPDVKDTNLWEQFTTLKMKEKILALLFLMSKIRTYESNSQHWKWKKKFSHCCSWCQRYELMRAIHN